MLFIPKDSPAARTALIYITIGSLILVWTAVWAVYLKNNPPEVNSHYYLCGGLLVTGIVVVAIGFGLGRIGRSAQAAELPPPETVQAAQTASQTAPAVVPAVPAAVPGVPAAGPTLAPTQNLQPNNVLITQPR